MKVIIRRSKCMPTGTVGRLVAEGGFACDTLELPWKDNQRGMSCIKDDSYIGWIWHSPTLGRPVIRLEDKHGRKDCLIHNATWAGDVSLDLDGDGNAGDLITQVHGCTAVGMGYGMIQRKDGEQQFGILSSKDTLARLVEHLGAGQHTFIYVWDAGCEP
jgi:hypothetical protein